MTRSSIDDHEIRRALADVLDLAPTADAQRERRQTPTLSPLPTPAQSGRSVQRRMLVPAAAAVLAVAGAVAVATIGPQQRTGAPAGAPSASPATGATAGTAPGGSGPQAAGSVTEAGSSAPRAATAPAGGSAPQTAGTVPGGSAALTAADVTSIARAPAPNQLGWPPLFSLGPDWRLASLLETSPDNGDFEFRAASDGADTDWHLVESTNAAGEETASEYVPGRGVITGQWLPGDRVHVLGLDSGNFDAIEGAPMWFAGAPARVFHVPDEQRYFVIVELAQGSIELVIQTNQRGVVQTIVSQATALDPEAFAATLPETVTAPDGYADLVTELLGDTPVPPSFRLDDAIARPSYTERAYLATMLDMQVVCSWLTEFYAAQGNDLGRFTAAAAALEAHATWPIAGEASTGYVDSVDIVIRQLDPDDEGLAAGFDFTPRLGWESLSMQLGCSPPTGELLAPVEPR